MSPRRVAVLADLGQDVYHAGDEAMGHAAADELLARGLRVLLLSRNPGQTEHLFGTEAVHTLAFPWPPAERETYFRGILDHLSGLSELPAGDPALTLIDELQKCDGVLIAGGGNLNSRFGWLLYERAAVIAIARSLGKPVVVSGQTLGPALTGVDALALASVLGAADLSGVREQASADVARRLDVSVVAGLDDASFLAAAGEGSSGISSFAEASTDVGEHLRKLPDSGYVAVTVSPYAGGPEDLYALLGAELDALHLETGLPSVFVPHLGTGTDGWDSQAHARIAASMSSPSQRLPVLPARNVAALTSGASLVVTSRYHPAVFALSKEVPVVALAVDSYSGVRLEGVMANWGLRDFVLPLPALKAGLLAPALAESWQRKTEISKHLKDISPSRKAWSRQWWDAVAAVFSGPEPGPESGPRTVNDLSAAPAFRASGSWRASAGEAAGGFYAESGLNAQHAVEQDRLRSYSEQRQRELEELRAEHERLLNSRTVKTALSLHRRYSTFFRR
ncbi:colanic acid/amylovoran biosynthesis protein [Arthrobacter sp. UYP6]|uniref:polysaccharide pyruvyl transferase family protein n=1 Tax=Arthrobacter sp. UYP6 TaxID=1756378 RepID=UPI003397AFAD